MVEDQYQFILHHKLLWKEDDVEGFLIATKAILVQGGYRRAESQKPGYLRQQEQDARKRRREDHSSRGDGNGALWPRPEEGKASRPQCG